MSERPAAEQAAQDGIEPVHDYVAEAAVVGAAMLHDGLARELTFLEPEDFSSWLWSVCWSEIQNLARRGLTPDLTAVTSELRRKRNLAPELLRQVADAVDVAPTEMYAAQLARRVKTIARLRRLQLTCYEIAKAASEPMADEDAERLLSRAPESVRQATGGTIATTPMRAAVDVVAEALWAGDDGVGPVEWCGITTIERLVGRMRPGLSIIGARTGLGKSTFLLQCAVRWASAGYRVLLCDMEMSEREVGRRLHRQCETLHLEVPQTLWITGPDIRDIGTICSLAEELLRDERPGLVCVDYVQLVTGAKAERRDQELAIVSRALHELGLRLESPVLAAAQLRRTRGVRPTLEDLRESGALEQDAGVVLLLVEGDDDLELRVAKNRYGPTGWTAVELEPASVRIKEVVHAAEERQ